MSLFPEYELCSLLKDIPMTQSNSTEGDSMSDNLTLLEYQRLVAWMKDPKRKPAILEFTASACRDAARAFEEAHEHMENPYQNPETSYPEGYKEAR